MNHYKKSLRGSYQLFSSGKRLQLFIIFALVFSTYQFFVAVERFNVNPSILRIFPLIAILFFIIINNKVNLRGLMYFLALSLIYISLLLIEYRVLILNYLYLGAILFYFKNQCFSFEDVIDAAYKAVFLIILLYFAMYYIGLFPDNHTEIGGRVRYYYGMTNPSKTGLLAFIGISIAYMWFFTFRRASFLVALLIVFLLYVLYKSDSRTPFLSLMVLISIHLFPRGFRSGKVFSILCVSIFSLVFYVSRNYYGSLLDVLLSMRLTFFNDYLSELSAKDYLLGASADGQVIDNSYILMYFTLTPIIIFPALIFIFLRQKFQGRELEVAFLYSMLAYGLFESVLVRVEFPITILFYAVLLGIVSKKKEMP